MWGVLILKYVLTFRRLMSTIVDVPQRQPPKLLSSSKCSLFDNSNVFGSCIIHILYTGCAKIKKNNSGEKRLTFRSLMSTIVDAPHR